MEEKTSYVSHWEVFLFKILLLLRERCQQFSTCWVRFLHISTIRSPQCCTYCIELWTCDNQKFKGILFRVWCIWELHRRFLSLILSRQYLLGSQFASFVYLLSYVDKIGQKRNSVEFLLLWQLFRLLSFDLMHK